MSRTNTLNILKLHPVLKVIKKEVRTCYFEFSFTNLNFNAAKHIEETIWCFFLASPHLQTGFIVKYKISCLFDSESVCHLILGIKKKKEKTPPRFVFLFVLRDDWKKKSDQVTFVILMLLLSLIMPNKAIKVSVCYCCEKSRERGLGSNKFCKPKQLFYRPFLKSTTNLSPIATF